MNTVAIKTSDERVHVSLKNLIDLAQPATSLDLNVLGIRSKQSGGYVSRFKGRGMEFDETRMYQAGDDIRSIDWKVTARTGSPHTKIFREERERPVFIALDNRATMQFATRGVFKSVLAAKLAGLLAWAAQQNGDRMGGQLFSEQACYELKPQSGKRAVLRFLHAIANPNAGRGDSSLSLAQVLMRSSQHAKPGSLLYIISDFRGYDDKAEAQLSKLAQHCDVVLIFIYDPLESHLPDKGRYRFTDDQRDVIVDSSDTQRLLAYQQRFAHRQEQLQQLASKHGLRFIQCSTTQEPLQCLR